MSVRSTQLIWPTTGRCVDLTMANGTETSTRAPAPSPISPWRWRTSPTDNAFDPPRPVVWAGEGWWRSDLIEVLPAQDPGALWCLHDHASATSGPAFPRGLKPAQDPWCYDTAVRGCLAKGSYPQGVGLSGEPASPRLCGTNYCDGFTSVIAFTRFCIRSIQETAPKSLASVDEELVNHRARRGLTSVILPISWPAAYANAA
jgi:hypothetical protein